MSRWRFGGNCRQREHGAQSLRWKNLAGPCEKPGDQNYREGGGRAGRGEQGRACAFGCWTNTERPVKFEFHINK